MNKREAAIVSAYTGILLGTFKELHKYIEEKLERPVMTHELASTSLVHDIKEATKKDFLSINIKY